MNRIKEKLSRGGDVLVFNPNFPSPALVEFAGEFGFDAAFIDCEHSAIGIERVEELARAARAAGITSIVRPWSREPGLVTRFLDCGVGGIQFPSIETADEAREAVGIVRQARGAAFDDTPVAIMVETPSAIEKLPEIVAVGGIDSVVVGLADLAIHLGHPGDGGHPDVRAAVDRIIGIVAGSGGPVAGFNLHNFEEGPTMKDKGVRWFTVHAKAMMRRGARDLSPILSKSGR